MLAVRRGAPASPYNLLRSYGSLIFTTDVSSALPSRKRLDQPGVLAILKRGKRLNRVDFELRFLISPADGGASGGKLAISVPKRLLKSAVARNRIKRLVREEFRGHRVSAASLHMLVSYKARNDGRDAALRRHLREELASLFDDASLRRQVDRTRARAG